LNKKKCWIVKLLTNLVPFLNKAYIVFNSV